MKQVRGLPPFLADALFELEYFEAAQVAVKFFTKIREKHDIQDKEVISLDGEEDGKDGDDESTENDGKEQYSESNEETKKGERKNKAEKINKGMDKLMQAHD